MCLFISYFGPPLVFAPVLVVIVVVTLGNKKHRLSWCVCRKRSLSDIFEALRPCLCFVWIAVYIRIILQHQYDRWNQPACMFSTYHSIENKKTLLFGADRHSEMKGYATQERREWKDLGPCRKGRWDKKSNNFSLRTTKLHSFFFLLFFLRWFSNILGYLFFNGDGDYPQGLARRDCQFSSIIVHAFCLVALLGTILWQSTRKKQQKNIHHLYKMWANYACQNAINFFFLSHFPFTFIFYSWSTIMILLIFNPDAPFITMYLFYPQQGDGEGGGWSSA